MNNIKNIIPFVLLLVLSSCGVVHKTFHKNKSQIDSTSVTKQNSDSLTKVDSSSLHKENTTTFTKSDSSRSDEQTTINEHTTIKEFNDSGKVKKETVIEKKTEIKKGNHSGTLTVFENAGKIDSSELKKETSVSKQSSDSSHVTKKEATKEVLINRTYKIWWFILLGVVILGSRWLWINRGKVKGFFVTVFAIVRHFFTGL